MKRTYFLTLVLAAAVAGGCGRNDNERASAPAGSDSNCRGTVGVAVFSISPDDEHAASAKPHAAIASILCIRLIPSLRARPVAAVPPRLTIRARLCRCNTVRQPLIARGNF